MSALGRLGLQPTPFEPATVEFGEWLPDFMNLNNPGAVEALNVIPRASGYVPYMSLAPVAGLVLPEVCRGAVTLTTRALDTRLYVGTVAALYVREGATFRSMWTSVINLNPAFLWQFVRYNDYLIALHPQAWPQLTDTSASVDFTDVGGLPPKAKVGAKIGEQLVLGNLEERDGTAQPQRIRWSGYGNIQLPWDSDPATQADFNDMPADGGEVMGITGREFGTVFQEKIISRMTYVGLPKVFDIETVEQARGALCSGGIVNNGAVVYYIANDGFFIWDGVSSRPIGTDRVNKYFRDRLNYGARARIVGTLDSDNECVQWAFPVGTSTTLTEILIYSYSNNRWAHAYVSVEYLVPSGQRIISLDDLLDPLESYTVSFDDPSYTEGRPTLAGFNTGHAYGSFTGPSLEATMDTAEATAPAGRRVEVSNARPLVDITESVVAVRTLKRDQLIGGDVELGPYIQQELTGECPILDEARYMRFRCNIPAGASWTHAQGVEVMRRVGGSR